MTHNSHRINKVKTHISLPKWLKDESEQLAAQRGYTMSELATKLYERWLEDEKQRIANEQGNSSEQRSPHAASVRPASAV